MNATVKWNVDPLQALNQLKQKVRNTAMRIAISAGAAPVKAAAVATSPTDKGNLAKSLRIKIKSYGANTVWIAMIGASKSYKRSKKSKKGKSVIQPAKYQKYNERGSKHQRATHFLAHALDRTQAQFVQVFQAKLKQQIEAML